MGVSDIHFVGKFNEIYIEQTLVEYYMIFIFWLLANIFSFQNILHVEGLCMYIPAQYIICVIYCFN